MNILSLHLSHEGCVTYVQNNQIIFHTQIDRYYRFKWYTLPSKKLIDFLKTLQIDVVLITWITKDNTSSIWLELFKSFPNLKNSEIIIYGDTYHHLFHTTCSLTWNKNIKNILVTDGHGTIFKNDFERESYYNFENNNLKHINTFTISEAPMIGSLYEEFTEKYFKHGLNCGKTMAWSLYDKKASYVQNRFESQMNDVIQRFNIKDEILFTGGCAQNILFNSTLLDKFNKVFCDPFNGDFGISLGAINFYTQNKIINNNIYLGIPQEINTDIFFKYQIIKTTPEEVTEILMNDPVAIFQSRSEQGQRGLGNRSLLMNPIHKEAQQKLNEIKKREWFRPFACSILKEKAKEWFAMPIDESPYMMYVFKLKKLNILTAGISIDNKSRIQTVTKENNNHYYELLKAFEKRSGIPILINTSLNLPGEVLTETLEDLKELFDRSKLKYIYLPEIQTLIKKC